MIGSFDPYSLRLSAAKLIDGKAIAKEIRDEVKAEVDQIKASGRRPPQLTVVLVGSDPASVVYVKNKIKACHYTGNRLTYQPWNLPLDEGRKQHMQLHMHAHTHTPPPPTPHTHSHTHTHTDSHSLSLSPSLSLTHTHMHTLPAQQCHIILTLCRHHQRYHKTSREHIPGRASDWSGTVEQWSGSWWSAGAAPRASSHVWANSLWHCCAAQRRGWL